MNTHKEYTSGLTSETRLINYLHTRGRTLLRSSKRENCELDIDCWEDNVPISIKTQHTCLKTGNLAFELELKTREGALVPGWFRSGEAKKYLILVGQQLYEMNKADICKYVLKYGWSRRAHLSLAKRQSQERIGHIHVDSEVGLLKLESLLEHKIIQWVGTVPTCVAFPDKHPVCNFRSN